MLLLQLGLCKQLPGQGQSTVQTELFRVANHLQMPLALEGKLPF